MQARYDVESRLLAWVEANAQVPADVRSRLVGSDAVLDSLALVSLTLLIEELLGRPIDPDDYADLEHFASVENIVGYYFDGAADAPS
jgi:acyl carrier protein